MATTRGGGCAAYLTAATAVPTLRAAGWARRRVIEGVPYGERRAARRGHGLVPSGRPRPGLGPGAGRARRRGLGGLGRLQASARPRPATPFEPVPCDTFITEATFGLPIYCWAEHRRRSRARSSPGGEENRAAARASVLFCYALGKAQRLLAELAAPVTDRPILVHGAVEPLNALLPPAPASPCRPPAW